MKRLGFRQSATPLTRAAARNYMFLNQLATPGLGSLLARRFIAGTGQLLAFLFGFCLVMAWFVLIIREMARQLETGGEPPQVGWLGAAGVLICVLAWLWSLITSISLLHEAKRNESNTAMPPPLPPL